MLYLLDEVNIEVLLPDGGTEGERRFLLAHRTRLRDDAQDAQDATRPVGRLVPTLVVTQTSL